MEFFVVIDSSNNWGDKQSSELMFTSLYGEYNIFIDNKLIGYINNGDSKIFYSILPGIRNIRVERINLNNQNFYFTLNRDIIFEPSTRVEIKWEAGPTLETSRGIIKYFIKKFSPKGIELIIKPFWPNTYVLYNSELLKEQTLIIEYPQLLKFSVVGKNNDFESLDIELIIQDEFEQVPKNLQLIVEVYLYKNPILF